MTRQMAMVGFLQAQNCHDMHGLTAAVFDANVHFGSGYDRNLRYCGPVTLSWV